MQWQQGALDSLVLAREAVDRAIAAYEKAREGQLSLDSGSLYEATDNANTAIAELVDFHKIAK